MAIRFLLLDYLRHLQQQGYDVAAMSAPGPWVGEIEAAGIRHLAVDFRRQVRPWADLRALAQITRVLRRERFDLVHLHTPKSLVIGHAASRLARPTPCVATIHGFYFHDHMPPWKRRWFVRLYRQALKRADLVFSLSAEDAETAGRERICKSGKLVLIGQGTDIERFSPATRERLRCGARRRLGLAPDALVVGTVARLTWEKGLAELLGAAQRVVAHHREAVFLVAGPDYVLTRAQLEGQAAQLGLGGRFRFLGVQTDMPAVYSAMDLFVLPSHREGVPLSLVEASAMALPVVATTIRGCREVVEDGVTGRLVPPRDREALASAIHALLANPGERQRLGEAARARAVERFDRRRVWAILDEHYGRLLR